MLSGFIFPICEHAGRRCSAITYVVPARYFLVALRGIVLKGAGLDVVWPQLAALAVFAVGRCWRWRRCGCAREWT